MLRIKDSVDLAGVQPEMFFAAVIVDQVYEFFGVPQTWITSAKDSEHGYGSLHNVGFALDFRTRHIPTEEAKENIGS